MKSRPSFRFEAKKGPLDRAELQQNVCQGKKETERFDQKVAVQIVQLLGESQYFQPMPFQYYWISAKGNKIRFVFCFM